MERGDDAGGDRAAEAVGIADGDDPSPTRALVLSPQHVGQVAAVDLQDGEVRRLVTADDARRIFLAVGGDDGDRVDRAGAVDALHEVVVGHDIAVGRDDEARADRAGLARALLLLRLLLAALGLRRIEAAEEFLERIGLRADRHALLGRDVDHSGLQPRGEVGEGHRRTGARSQTEVRRVLRDLGAGLASGEENAVPPKSRAIATP